MQEFFVAHKDEEWYVPFVLYRLVLFESTCLFLPSFNICLNIIREHYQIQNWIVRCVIYIKSILLFLNRFYSESARFVVQGPVLQSMLFTFFDVLNRGVANADRNCTFFSRFVAQPAYPNLYHGVQAVFSPTCVVRGAGRLSDSFFWIDKKRKNSVQTDTHGTHTCERPESEFLICHGIPGRRSIFKSI